jgi:hypothetical protein
MKVSVVNGVLQATHITERNLYGIKAVSDNIAVKYGGSILIIRTAIIIGIARNVTCEGSVRAARVSGCKVYGIVKACPGRGQYCKAHYVGGNSRIVAPNGR